ncbi:MAG: proline--tRNA ligase [Phycisphaerales bacterium]|nr:proline--tRNA ligase [Phycisphaerales bacterium]
MNRPSTAVSAPVQRGSIARWNQTMIPTTREAPADAESPSHILLSRAGYIRKLGAGIYDYLPLAWRVIKKVSAIVREEMDAAGASELHLPVLLPIELYAGTRRDRDYGDLLFKINDRKAGTYALGPTHEEPITELVKGSVSSYKQLPINLYQIQVKFRDEARPRSGLLRGREFIMKDAYSFHMNVEGPGGLNETYDKMYQAYSNVFRRCGLSFTAVEAESGPIGGSASHEFMVNCESGEDTVLRCPASGYAANVEKCEIGARPAPSKGYFGGDPSGVMEEVHTPGCPGIEDVCTFMKVKPGNMLKSVLFKVVSSAEDLAKYGEEYILAVVRGDHDVNEGKVKAAAGVKAIALADPAEAIKKGFAIGFVSPRAAVGKPGVLLLVDREAAVGFDDAAGKAKFWVTGADKKDHHVKHFNWVRDLGTDPLAAEAHQPETHGTGGLKGGNKYMMVADVRNAVAGDPSPRSAGAKLETSRGIEVGHIFKLGTKYSEAMGLAILDDKQQKRPVIMGCYGIGVSRTMASSVEQNHDADGIIWPAAIAPFGVLITIMKHDAPEQTNLAADLAEQLAAAGVDVLIDDRDERPGVKFKDADLIGIPVRLTLGDKALAAASVEFKLRSSKDKGSLVPIAEVVAACVNAVRGNG